ncbi:hypothetical protein YT1_2949 [Rhodococcus ruber]|nr:hypothetical protein YT1_2949 [Rhodococcus ruber]
MRLPPLSVIPRYRQTADCVVRREIGMRRMRVGFLTAAIQDPATDVSLAFLAAGSKGLP